MAQELLGHKEVLTIMMYMHVMTWVRRARRSRGRYGSPGALGG